MLMYTCLVTCFYAAKGVIIHGIKKDYCVYVCPPWVKTGYNITGSIFADLISKGRLTGTHELRLQLDGASDNVCVDNVQFWIWQLLFAQAHGLTLQCVRISRLIVGHTHFDVDQLFAVFSMYMFGKRSDMGRRRNVFTPSEFKAAIHEAHANNLADYVYMGATYNFKEWLKCAREPAPDVQTGIKMAYVIELSTSPDNPGLLCCV